MACCLLLVQQVDNMVYVPETEPAEAQSLLTQESTIMFPQM